jgi:hypothetical protein
MKYILLIAETQVEFDLRNDPEKSPAYWAAWKAYSEALKTAGVMVSSLGLPSPKTATTVRVRDGRRQIHDGPYAETKEFLGGFAVLEVPDLDAAIAWAARCPAAGYGAVEVRPTPIECGC